MWKVKKEKVLYSTFQCLNVINYKTGRNCIRLLYMLY